MADLLDLFDELESSSKKTFKPLRAPFSYPGGKSRSLQFILPNLPNRKVYTEVFGGSGAVLLNRERCNLEVFNDAHSGVTAFYRCLRDRESFDKLVDWLTLTVHSREEFHFCKDTWEDCKDPIERAARWYYMVQCSFGSKGYTWGRAKGGDYIGIPGRIQGKLKSFEPVARRMQRVQVENMDAMDCLRDYDTMYAVHYLDPPYMECDQSIYKHNLNKLGHTKLMECVFGLKGFVAVSGFANDIYDNYPWDDKFSWDVSCSIKSATPVEGNNYSGGDRTTMRECLWIKEAK